MRKIVCTIVTATALNGIACGKAFSAEHNSIATPVAASLEFALQENLDPWNLAPCEHEQESTTVDWLVTCKLGQTKHVFRVHLVIHRYAKTRFGQSAHEILYWVTDSTNPRHPQHASTTVWVHHRQGDVDATVMELAQGVENDLKALRLKVSM